MPEPIASDGAAVDSRPLGVFDSGVGGLSVLRHLCAELPGETILYFADQAHIPYGRRPPEEIQRYAVGITRFLRELDARLIVVACNAASAAALDHLRAQLPDIPFVGMEPAVKPAAQQTRSGKVGVLATPGTFNSHRYASLMARYAEGIQVYEDPCDGLVQLIEVAAIEATTTRDLLERVVSPMLTAGVDTFVLGCTHYPFIVPVLRSIVGDDVAIIDPAPAVARRTLSVLQQNGSLALPAQDSEVRCFTSGQAGPFADVSRRLLGWSCDVREARWHDDAKLIKT